MLYIIIYKYGPCKNQDCGSRNLQLNNTKKIWYIYI